MKRAALKRTEIVQTIRQAILFMYIHVWVAIAWLPYPMVQESLLQGGVYSDDQLQETGYSPNHPAGDTCQPALAGHCDCIRPKFFVGPLTVTVASSGGIPLDSLHDKVVVITGAGSGFGREFANLGAQAGMKLVLADVQQDAPDETAAQLQVQGAKLITLRVDVSRSEQVEGGCRLLALRRRAPAVQ